MFSLNEMISQVLAVGLLSLALPLAVVGSPDEAKDKAAWVNLSKDGTPWTHPETGLQFPQLMGGFTLEGGYKDKNRQAGLAITYTKKESNLKADVIIAPCPHNLAADADVVGIAKKELESLGADLVAIAKGSGYAEQGRSKISEQKLPIWDRGEIPFVSMTIDLAPASPAKGVIPPINQWLAVLIYHDHFVQFNVIMPTARVKQVKPEADEMITNLLQCLRYPALKPEMLKVCRSYMEEPLTDTGRKTADALLTFSKESPIFEIIFPGEALTKALDEISVRSKEAALDLLRAFMVGSGVVTLQNGSSDESLEEGARLMIGLRRLMQEKSMPVDSAFLDDLTKASDQLRGAEFLKEQMRSIPPAQ